VSLFIVTHHGFNQSNAKALVAAIRPEAAIMNNGAHKGASPDAWRVVHDAVDAPVSRGKVRIVGQEHLWQLHHADDNPQGDNVGADFIANPQETSDGGYEIRALANADGTFLIINTSNQSRQEYGPGTGF
jgi:hypothetical protein